MPKPIRKRHGGSNALGLRGHNSIMDGKVFEMKIKLSQSDWKAIGQKMGWLKEAQYKVPRNATEEHFNKAAELCMEQAEKSVAGSRQGIDALADVYRFSIRGIDLSTEDGREEAMDHLDAYCEEVENALVSSGAKLTGLRGAVTLLNEAMAANPTDTEKQEG
jgi:hypothetical protein